MTDKRYNKYIRKYNRRLEKFSKHYCYSTHNEYNVSRFARLCVRYFGIAKFIVGLNKGIEDYETTMFDQFATKRNNVIHHI